MSSISSTSHAGFVHLRVHSAYSLLEGAIHVKDLAALCRAAAFPAVAITDSNNLFGALEFSKACATEGVQPIIGCQINLLRSDNIEGEQAADADSIVLLVQNETGYANLLKLISLAYLGDGEGEPLARPEIAFAGLEKHVAGLIAFTGGPFGPIGRLLAGGKAAAAEEMLVRLAAAFPGRLYVELMRHGLEVERRIEGVLVDLAYKHGLPLIATNEVFFSAPDMFEAHDALVCIAEHTYVNEQKRKRLTPEYYFKSAAEMRALFADLPEAVDNTLIVAKRCAFMVEGRDPILPTYDCGEGRDEKRELKEQAGEGLEARLKAKVFKPGMDEEEKQHAAKPYRERLEYELRIIGEMGFPGYFLIVAEFIHWAKKQGIPVGPGRGSGAGSVVAWALTITDLDPLRFGLLFERFLNPERVSMPDFDIDFCQDRRDEVIRHVQEKYGRDHVAQIITFGKLQARAVLRDVGRVLEMPYGQVDRICKLVPNNPAAPLTLDQAQQAEPQLRRMVEDDPAVKRLMDTARRLEGLYRHASTHAAGVVIGDRPLDELIPLYRDPGSDMPVTGFSMKFVEQAGLVKFDFLGLKTLTVLARAIELIGEGGGGEVDLANIPLDDERTFEMLGQGHTVGVFQLESSGMRDVLLKLKPDAFEEIIAVVALYRPGPMDNIPSYIHRKHGEEEIDYLYPSLEAILKPTFGIMIYQEQVMQIAQELSGYTLGNADLLRRAMGKKIKKEMDQQRQSFVDGATNKGVPEGKASRIFDQVAKFAGYGFNKSHAAAYALVAYQTAYMKANYPVEFMAASMTLDMGNTDKLNGFCQELNRMGIEVLPPDVNASRSVFAVERGGDGKAAVRYALAAIKNVGAAAMKMVVAERCSGGPFTGLYDFCSRLDSRVTNKRQMENLVRAGAFDCLNANRKQTFDGLETFLRRAQAEAEERRSGQIGLFGGEGSAEEEGPKFSDTPDWRPMQRLSEEFNAIGFFLSAHPLDAYARNLERLKVRPIAEILKEGDAGLVNMAGIVQEKKERTSAKGSRYAFVTLSDASGVYEITVFAELLSQARDILEPGRSLFIRAAVQFEGDSPRFTAHSLELLDRVAAAAAAGMRVVVESASPLGSLQGILGRQGRGKGPVKVVARTAGRDVEIELAASYAVTPEVLLEVKSLPGVVEVGEI
jgi:DNA polymerase-3 subunit alpha